MKKLYALTSLFLFIGSIETIGQGIDNRISWVMKDVTSQRVFVENKGQFIPPAKAKDAAILFAYDEGGQKIYFTQTGIVYSFTEKKLKNADHGNKFSAESEEKEEEKNNVDVKSAVVTMNWLGANPNAELVAEDMAPDYYSYTIKEKSGEWKNINYIKAYKKLV